MPRYLQNTVTNITHNNELHPKIKIIKYEATRFQKDNSDMKKNNFRSLLQIHEYELLVFHKQPTDAVVVYFLVLTSWLHTIPYVFYITMQENHLCSTFINAHIDFGYTFISHRKSKTARSTLSRVLCRESWWKLYVFVIVMVCESQSIQLWFNLRCWTACKTDYYMW